MLVRESLVQKLSEVMKMKGKMMRRGQAALEFLTTYGWAFLVILVMIGALAYFGVINPNKFLPERCVFQQELTCKDYQVIYDPGTDTATVKFFVTNNLGAGISNINFYVNQSDALAGQSGAVCTADTTAKIPAGQSVGFTCSNIQGSYAGIGEKVKFVVSGNYTLTGGAYSRSMQGEIFATLRG